MWQSISPLPLHSRYNPAVGRILAPLSCCTLASNVSNASKHTLMLANVADESNIWAVHVCVGRIP